MKKLLGSESAEAPRKAGRGERGKTIKLHRKELGPVEMGYSSKRLKLRCTLPLDLYFNSVFSSSFYKTISPSKCPIGELSEACLFSASVLHEFLDSGVG